MLKDYIGKQVLIYGFFKEVKPIYQNKLVVIVNSAFVKGEDKNDPKNKTKELRIEYIQDLRRMNIYFGDLISVCGTISYNKHIHNYEVINTQSIRLTKKISPYWNNEKLFITDHEKYDFEIVKFDFGVDNYLKRRYSLKTIEELEETDLQIKVGDKLILYLGSITENLELNLKWRIDGVNVIMGTAFVNVLTENSIVLNKKYLLKLPAPIFRSMRDLVVQILYFKPLVQVPYSAKVELEDEIIKLSYNDFILCDDKYHWRTNIETTNARCKLFNQLATCNYEFSESEINYLYNNFEKFNNKTTQKFFNPDDPNYQDKQFLQSSIQKVYCCTKNDIKKSIFYYLCVSVK